MEIDDAVAGQVFILSVGQANFELPRCQPKEEMADSGTGKAGRLEDLYRMVRKAVATRRPMGATYHNRYRLLCPHRLGRNKAGQLRVLCYQYGGESESGLRAAGSPANWRCIALDKLGEVEILSGAWRTAPNHSRPGSCVVDADVDAEDYPLDDPQQGR
jgi:hypothetical protein